MWWVIHMCRGFDPLFHFGRIEHDLFGVFFLIHQHKNDLLGTNPRKIRSFWPQNTIFPSIFLGPIFSGPRHTPSNFRTEYPPPGTKCSFRAYSLYMWSIFSMAEPTPSRVQARALCFLSLFGVLGARPTHPVRLQAYMAKQAERWRLKRPALSVISFL